jgi:hypothetical protein
MMQVHPVAGPVRRSLLTIAAEVLVIIAATLVIGRTTIDALRPPPPAPKIGGMTWTSYATNNAASFAFTNLTTETRVVCVKGVVTSKESRISIESLPICSGEVKPNSSVRIEASWPKGSPDDICNKEGTFGKVLDWSKCTFTSEEVTPAGVVAVTAGAASSK